MELQIKWLNLTHTLHSALVPDLNYNNYSKFAFLYHRAITYILMIYFYYQSILGKHFENTK